MSQHAALYNSSRWKQRRRRQLEQFPLCKFCLELHDIVTAATVADHVEPHRGDVEKFYNGALQSLCIACHSSLKQQQETTGRMTAVCVHGLPLDRTDAWSCEQCQGGPIRSASDRFCKTGAPASKRHARSSATGKSS